MRWGSARFTSVLDQPLVQLLGAAYPVSDIMIITVLLLVMRRATAQQRGSMFLLLGGLAANSVADSAFAYLNAAGTYGAIGNVLDAGWVIGYLMVALAPLWPSPFVGTVARRDPSTSGRCHCRGSRCSAPRPWA